MSNGPTFKSLLKTKHKISAVIQLHTSLLLDHSFKHKTISEETSQSFSFLEPERQSRIDVNLTEQEGCVLTNPAWIRNKQTNIVPKPEKKTAAEANALFFAEVYR